MSPPASSRLLLLELFQAAVQRVDGTRCTFDTLKDCGDMAPTTALIAIGKAAGAMARGAVLALGDRIERGLVITRYGHLPPTGDLPASFTLLEAGHPLPDQNSLDAGTALLAFLARGTPEEERLFLISGGASSLVEVLPGGMTLATLDRLNHWLLSHGEPIAVINGVRKRCSMIKGGRLATSLGPHNARVLMISDVEGDDPSIIGSGLLSPDAQGRDPGVKGLPDWITACMRQAPALPAKDDKIFSRIREMRVIAALDDALQAVVASARERGLKVHRAPGYLAGDALVRGREIGRALRGESPGVYLWGGETTIELPSEPGAGGRNQSLALAAAIEIAGRDDICVLAAGTDGSDGPTDVAGAVVDGGTIARGSAGSPGHRMSDRDIAGARHALRAADAGTFLREAGDLVDTGPTGTNVNDIVIGFVGR